MWRKEIKNLKRKCTEWGMLLLLLVCGVFVVTNCKVVTVRAETRTFKVNGRTYIEKHSEGGYYDTMLYQKVSGHTKQVAKISKWISYRFSYGKKLYFTEGGEGRTCFTYTYTIDQRGFKLERKNMLLTEHRGRYAIGYITQAGDPSPSQLCCYDLSRKKMIKLGLGCDIKFIGNKIYYASVCNKHTMQIIRRNANGGGKKVLKTVREDKNHVLTYMEIMNLHQARYFVSPSWGEKTVRF